MEKIYQFIKYNQNTKIDHIKNYGNDKLIICFDFEDGIQNILNNEKTKYLKEKHREYCTLLVHEFDKSIKIGVRLNAKDTIELQKDISSIKSINIHSIFLPKIENSQEIISIVHILDDNKIKYKEIIPIIENRKGLDNINNIIKVKNIKNLAFGHCDYNMSLNILPFFHQESNEYWKWVSRIILYTNKKNICYINSPCLSSQNEDLFISMLEHLKNITNKKFSQITLSNGQTKLCLKEIKTNTNFKKLLNNRHMLYPTNEFIDNTIEKYEKYNTGKGLTKSGNQIISFHEYVSAKKYKRDKKKALKLAFVGGCFPVQHNILYEDIFLTKTKKLTEQKLNIELQTDIIRYERFINVLEKIKKENATKRFDYLIFSIRPEPYFRLIKFYYKFINNEGKLKRSLNLPFLNIVNPEKYDYLFLGRRYDYRIKPQNNNIHNRLVNLNYIIGKIIGNKSYALKKYIELIENVKIYCSQNNIELILLGPNLRAKTKSEPKFCKELYLKTKERFLNLSYINCIIENDKPVYKENKIHVNELYHKLIADKIFIVLSELLSPTKNILHLADNANNEDDSNK